MNLDDLFGAVFVVSLPGSDVRRRSVIDQFRDKRLGTYEWIDAIDGSALDLPALRSNGQLVFCEDQSRSLLPGEVGCYFSHLKAFELLNERGLERALICEDDVVFTEDAIEIFVAVTRELPDDWDIVHFHSHVCHGKDTLRQRNRRPVSPYVRHGWNESHGTLCYALSTRCAEYFLAHAFPIKNPIDGVTNWPSSEWCSAYRGYIADPFPCFPGEYGSDIGSKAQRQRDEGRHETSRL